LGPVVHISFPNMWKTLWALITQPPHLVVAVRPDDTVAKVHVALYMPLCLQLFCKQADIGPNLFRLLFVHLLHAVIAVADVRGIPCKAAWRQPQLSIQDERSKHMITSGVLCFESKLSMYALQFDAARGRQMQKDIQHAQGISAHMSCTGSGVTHLCRGLTTAANRGSCANLQACTV